MRRPVGAVETATVVRGSRFLARLARGDDPAGAEAILRDRSTERPDATHHCWAYRTWEAGRIMVGAFDAGEPAGTAGRPIAGALERADLVQAVCVVSRWFGGVKLGTGGLTRAYGDVAATVIAAAADSRRLEPVEPHAEFRLRFDYDRTAAVDAVISRYRARERDATYGAEVTRSVSVPVERAEAFARALAEAGRGALRVDRLGDRLEAVIG